MKGRCPQVARQVDARLAQSDRNARVSQKMGGDKTDGPGPDDDHALRALSFHAVP